ncbi:hypothetical protein Afil01_05370 [Actinorhabdospora filicis]|uniref:Uncharacterized protein n=1 Tax=Actinorhabdospora filicis TaxID=1785913 RepID=A0A9W6SEH5_9ACTN|nr:hypothetical protein Afil01_05370 [Actinorhabdospora filicis]
MRRAAAVTLAAGTLPYLSLKISWLAGGRLGLGDLADSAQLTALNGFTAGMDAVAFLLAGVFFFRRGLRAPAWLPVFPIWVGTGLLGQLLVQVPTQLAASVLSGEAVASGKADTAVHSWVYLVVYAGFCLQGVALVTAFALYARERWAGAFTGRTDDASPLRALLRPVSLILAVVTGLLALFHLSLAAGSTWGISADHVATFGVPVRAAEVAVAAVFAVAAYGLLATGGHLRGRRRWTATVALWLGSGAMFGWGMWTLVVLLASDTGIGVRYSPDLTSFEALGRFTVGILAGFTLLVAHAAASLKSASGDQVS